MRRKQRRTSQPSHPRVGNTSMAHRLSRSLRSSRCSVAKLQDSMSGTAAPLRLPRGVASNGHVPMLSYFAALTDGPSTLRRVVDLVDAAGPHENPPVGRVLATPVVLGPRSIAAFRRLQEERAARV